MMNTDISSNLIALGWMFCPTGPDSWNWIKFDRAGQPIATEGDPAWRSDLKASLAPSVIPAAAPIAA